MDTPALDNIEMADYERIIISGRCQCAICDACLLFDISAAHYENLISEMKYENEHLKGVLETIRSLAGANL